MSWGNWGWGNGSWNDNSWKDSSWTASADSSSSSSDPLKDLLTLLRENLEAKQQSTPGNSPGTVQPETPPVANHQQGPKPTAPETNSAESSTQPKAISGFLWLTVACW